MTALGPGLGPGLAQGQGPPGGALKGKVILSLPEIHADIVVVQTSTMGRYVAGGLDRSCFDISSVVHMGPLSLHFNPRGVMSYVPMGYPTNTSSSSSSSSSGGSGGSGGTTRQGQGQAVLWKGYRILRHLWARTVPWTKGDQGFGGGHYSRYYPLPHPPTPHGVNQGK